MSQMLGKGKPTINETCRSTSNRHVEGKPRQKLVYSFRKLLDKVVARSSASAGTGIENETDGGEQVDSVPRQAEHRISDLNNYDSFNDQSENQLCTVITEQLEYLFTSHGKNNLDSHLLVPSDLSSRIAQDVLRVSQNEPCGIRGCELFITLQDKSTCRKMGVIDCDPSTVATFELYLTVKVDRRPSAIVKSMLISLQGRLVHGNSNSTKVLHPEYQLTKRKLHRPN
ncbi:DNA damage-inducible transcript 4-like protein [Liolophura sinensis]|uniref:DNA damage-inducible transcript 4-like protein n=1 Tax=Liolophura sinensis TaxID=3198878 RepID=UPI003158D88C